MTRPRVRHRRTRKRESSGAGLFKTRSLRPAQRESPGERKRRSLERIRAIHRGAIPEKPGETVDRRTGRQQDRYWLPEPLREELIAEHRRPEDEKTGIAAVKFFNPGGAGTWYVSEYDPEHDVFFGVCEIQEKELGYASARELRELRAPPFGLYVERDYYWTPRPLEEIMRE